MRSSPAALRHPALLALVAELLAAAVLWAVAHAAYGARPALDPAVVSSVWLGALAFGGSSVGDSRSAGCTDSTVREARSSPRS